MDEISERSASREAAPVAVGSPIEDRRQPEPIDPAHAAIVERGRKQARRGQYASSDDVAAVFRRAGL